jgi:hypothetical protein
MLNSTKAMIYAAIAVVALCIITDKANGAVTSDTIAQVEQMQESSPVEFSEIIEAALNNEGMVFVVPAHMNGYIAARTLVTPVIFTDIQVDDAIITTEGDVGDTFRRGSSPPQLMTILNEDNFGSPLLASYDTSDEQRRSIRDNRRDVALYNWRLERAFGAALEASRRTIYIPTIVQQVDNVNGRMIVTDNRFVVIWAGGMYRGYGPDFKEGYPHTRFIPIAAWPLDETTD